MPSRIRASTKTGIRRLIRRLGYDIVPLVSGLSVIQRDVLARTRTVLDVGANVGQFAERLLDLGYSGKIISFEPSASAFDILRAKAARRHSWEARCVALGDKEHVATLNISANSVSSSLLRVGEVHLRAAPRSAVVGREEVQVSTLDAQIDSSEGDGIYLKLDVQGFELPVLTGSERTLARTHAVQFEVSFDTLYEDQSQWLEVCAFLQDRGFIVRYVEPGYEDAGRMLQADVLMMRDNMPASSAAH